MRRAVWTFPVLAAAVLAVAAYAKDDEKAKELKVGDKAPAFSAKDDEGKEWKSEDHVGKKILVVYFYPADCTRGCTAQAQAFRDKMETLKGKDVEVVGVSGDTVENHKVFKKKEKLNFTLLADTEGAVAKALGVPFKAGKGEAKTKFEDQDIVLTREGTSPRWTFVIDKEGKIVHKNTMVKAAEDADAVLKVVEGLK